MAQFAQAIEFGPFFVSGAPDNGPKLFHYAAGTTNLLDIFSDRAKTTPLAQPFVGDSRGLFQFYGDGIYKFQIQDHNSNVLYTLDNFNLAEPPLLGKGASITSGATLTMGTDGAFFHVTGTTTITAFSGNQSFVFLTFDGILTLTYNATSLILLGAASRSTVAGETVIFINEGSGNWREVGKAIFGSNNTWTGTNTFASLTISTAASQIIPGATSLSLRNNAGNADNVLVADAGDITLRKQLTVANGGTGDTSLTPYAVLCGGTTGTGAVQSVAALGASGTALTSNGAGALPTFQTLTGTLTAGTLLTKNPVVYNSATTQAHGLGVEPTFLKIVLQNVTAEAGYTSGQRVMWSSFSVNSNNSGIAVRIDATNVILAISSDLTITPAGGGAVVALTAANWQIIITPYKLN